MVSGGVSEIFRAKRRGGISKIEGGKGGHASICTGLRGAFKFFEGKMGGDGGHAIFIKDYLKTIALPVPYP